LLFPIPICQSMFTASLVVVVVDSSAVAVAALVASSI
jgi:hypothetical protein